MTKVLTIRVPVDLLHRAEAKAALLGLDRTKYLRGLIEDDLKAGAVSSSSRFASEDLAGIHVAEEPRPATNARVREMMRSKARERNR
ncbi:MAG TPA: hypothetical protein VM511_03260 [Luteolibacter sp.]|nr:hypothetical protein [Luteolibacter sp.]